MFVQNDCPSAQRTCLGDIQVAMDTTKNETVQYWYQWNGMVF